MPAMFSICSIGFAVLAFSFAPSGLESISFVDPRRRSFHCNCPRLFSFGLGLTRSRSFGPRGPSASPNSFRCFPSSSSQPFEFGCWDIELALSFKHPHLRRRTDRRIFRADRQEAHVVAEARGDAVGPFLKLRPRPLEAMVAMTEVPRRKAFPFHVVFAVGCCVHRQNHGRAVTLSCRRSGRSQRQMM